jgi:NAD(P)-dependent dehydrogenase (short-subunit alcohol dehydrogenase family)
MAAMALFTFVMDFPGGTNISQFRAVSSGRAVAQYASHLSRDKDVATLPVGRRTVAPRRFPFSTLQGFDHIWRERAAGNPAKRYGRAPELGAYCAFLCSQHAGYVTGQNILVDGGSYPGTF